MLNKLHFAGDSHPTIHFCMCSLAFPSSYKQPDIIKVNTQPTLIHIARSLRNREPSIVDTAYCSCCSFSCFPPSSFILSSLFLSHLCDSLPFLSEALRSFPPEFCGNLDV